MTYRVFCRDLRGMWKFFCFLRFFSLYPPFRPHFQPFVDCTAGQTRNTYVGHDNVYMPPPFPLSLRLFLPSAFLLAASQGFFTYPLRLPLFRRLSSLFFCPLFCLFYIPLPCPAVSSFTPARFFTRLPPLFPAHVMPPILTFSLDRIFFPPLPSSWPQGERSPRTFVPAAHFYGSDRAASRFAWNTAMLNDSRSLSLHVCVLSFFLRTHVCKIILYPIYHYIFAYFRENAVFSQNTMFNTRFYVNNGIFWADFLSWL